MRLCLPGTTANTITAVGTGYEHNHGNLGVVFSLDVLLNSVWTNVYSRTQDANNTSHTLASFGTFNFAQGSVTGIRLGANPVVGNAYHSMGSEQFVFGNSAVTPEGSSLAMIALGGLPLAVGFQRKFRRKTV